MLHSDRPVSYFPELAKFPARRSGQGKAASQDELRMMSALRTEASVRGPRGPVPADLHVISRRHSCVFTRVLIIGDIHRCLRLFNSSLRAKR